MTTSGFANGTFPATAINAPTSIASPSANPSVCFLHDLISPSLRLCPQLQTTSSRNRAGAVAGGVVRGLAACLLVVVVTMMYNRHCRNLRKRMTQLFMMKGGLVLVKPGADSKDVVSEDFAYIFD
jgi:type VI protein secretion system component VasK